MSRRSRCGALLTAALVGTAGLLAPTDALASSSYPSPPAHVHVAKIGTTSFSVAAHRSAHTRRYRVYASTVRRDIFVRNLHHKSSHRKVRSARHPLVHVGGLRYTTATYYYRFATTNGSHVRVSAIRTVLLRPAAPTGVRVVSGRAGLYVSWHSASATSYVITQSADAAARHGRHDYTIRGQNSRFTPYGLHTGTRYYFRVRARNGSTTSGYSSAASGVSTAREQNLRVLTYNILSWGFDGKTEGGQHVAPWYSKRLPAAAALIGTGDPDVIAIAEGGAYHYKRDRQVDTLRTALGSRYTVAHTETTPREAGFTKPYGDYIIYRNTALAAVGAGGHFSLGDGLVAAYQLLRSRTTGVTFLMVATHLRAGVSRSLDRLRQRQAQSVINGAKRVAAHDGGVPIVYAGDFNSLYSHYHPTDGPGAAMRGAGASDSYYVSQAMSGQQYDSNNRYLRTPPRGLGSIDRIFATPGVALRSWRELLRLTHGRFAGTIPSDHNPVLVGVTVPG